MIKGHLTELTNKHTDIIISYLAQQITTYNNMKHYNKYIMQLWSCYAVLISPQCHHEPLLRANGPSKICILLLN